MSDNNLCILLRDKLLLLYIYRGVNYYISICINYIYEILLVIINLSNDFFFNVLLGWTEIYLR